MNTNVRPWLLITLLATFLPAALVKQALTTSSINYSVCFTVMWAGILVYNNNSSYITKISKPIIVVSLVYFLFVVWGNLQTFDPINSFWLWRIFG